MVSYYFLLAWTGGVGVDPVTVDSYARSPSVPGPCTPSKCGIGTLWGLPFSTYAPRGGGVIQVSYTFPLRITCKKKGGGEGSR